VKISTVILGCIASILISGCDSKQKVVYQVDSIEYSRSEGAFSCNKRCSEVGEDLQAHLDEGWEVVTSSSKSNHPMSSANCTCIGTEYILKK